MIARRFSRPKATRPSVAREEPSEPKSRVRRIAAPLLGALAVAGICLPELLILIALAGSLTLGAFLGVAAGAVALALVAGFVLRHIRRRVPAAGREPGAADEAQALA